MQSRDTARTAKTLGPSERRKRKDGALTRERLIAAGIEVMAEHGAAALTLASVAARAGVTRGTAYHHFTGLPDLLQQIRENLEEQLNKRVEGPHQFSNPLGLAIRLAAEDENIIRSRIRRILEQGPESDQRTQHLVRRFAALENSGLLRPGIDAGSAAALFAALDFAGLIVLGLTNGQDERRAAAARLSDTWYKIVFGAVLDEKLAQFS